MAEIVWSTTRVNESGGLQLLLGGWTYEEMLGYWNTQNSLFTQGLKNAPKYVVPRTLREPLRWPNSTLLQSEAGDAAKGVVIEGVVIRRSSTSSDTTRRKDTYATAVPRLSIATYNS
jgi:hypothetical protein